jgi:hypothetical protein
VVASEFDFCFRAFNDDNEVDRRISEGVCVETLFIKESVFDADEDFLVLSERGDSFSLSLDLKTKLCEGDERSNSRVFF